MNKDEALPLKDKDYTEALNRIRDSKGRFTQAPPYGFKKGQVANPKGGPRSSLTKREKLILLSEMARINLKKANPVEAIREHNKMVGAYLEGIQDNRQYNIYIKQEAGEDVRKELERLIAGERQIEVHDAIQITGSTEGSQQKSEPEAEG